MQGMTLQTARHLSAHSVALFTKIQLHQILLSLARPLLANNWNRAISQT